MKHTEQVGSNDPSDHPFDIVSDAEFSSTDQFRRTLDGYVFAPIRVALTDKRALVGILIILLYVLMGTIGVLVIPEPHPNAAASYLSPFQNMKYPLGTDNLGNSILGQVVHATPAMLEMVFAGAVFSTSVATIIGTVSGYKGGQLDRILMSITDVMMTIPGLPLVILLAVLIQPRNPIIVALVLTINAWAGLARSIRSQVLTIRDQSYVEASRLMGAPTWKIVKTDILPNLMSYILINFVQSGRNVIFASVGLYFLGILPFSNANWGVMMNTAYTTGGSLYTWSTAYWLIIPMIAIVLLSYGLILFSQGMDRVFNPRVRARHAKTIGKEPDHNEPESNEATSGAAEW